MVTAARIRAVVADDDVLLREGIASLLERSSFEVVGLAGNGPELVSLVRAHLPHVAVVDIRMPPTHTTEGLEAAQAIRSEFPGVGILVLSAHVELHRAVHLLCDGGGVGYLLKGRVTDVRDFVDALQRVATGGSAIDPALVGGLLAARGAEDPLADLTPREREVLRLMAEGRSNAGIGRQLWVTEATVHKHVQRIFAKLPLSDSDDDHRRVLAVLAFLQARSRALPAAP